MTRLRRWLLRRLLRAPVDIEARAGDVLIFSVDDDQSYDDLLNIFDNFAQMLAPIGIRFFLMSKCTVVGLAHKELVDKEAAEREGWPAGEVVH